MTKFYTDSKKRVRPISNKRRTGTLSRGTAHLNVPKKLGRKTLVYPLPKNSVYADPSLYVDNRTGKDLKMVWMTPKKFLEQCSSPNYFVTDKSENAYTAKEGYNRKIVDKYKKDMLDGEELPALLIDHSDKGRRGFSAHNGRHRAKAALELGIKKVPVVVVTEKRSE